MLVMQLNLKKTLKNLDPPFLSRLLKTGDLQICSLSLYEKKLYKADTNAHNFNQDELNTLHIHVLVN